MNVVALAGGVGGAKLVEGLAQCLPPEQFSVIVNTGDDFEHLSLLICPDLDTVCYTLAGLANPETGWGRRDETWVVFEHLKKMDGPGWFQLGDKDLATHLTRTTRLAQGHPLSIVTSGFCSHWGINHAVYPMSDDTVRTIIHTTDGQSLGFQEYFVKLRFEPKVTSIEFSGASVSKPVVDALQKINKADLVILAPSNPFVSIDPILSVPGYLSVIKEKPVIAVSPLVGGRALKGPAAKMFQEMGIQPSAAAVAAHYRDWLTGFVLHTSDANEFEKISRSRIIPLVTDIIMNHHRDRVRLAEDVLKFGETLLTRSR